MKTYDLVRMSLGNLSRRKGRTALTVIGVVVGICAIVVLISLGLAINANNEEMLQSWGDLTKIEIYNWGGNTGQETPALDDEMLARIQTWDHVAAVSPHYQAQNLNGNILSGKNGRYSQSLWNAYGMYTNAVEAMGVRLLEGKYLTDDMNPGKNKIPVLVGENMAYQFEDTRRSYNSPKRWVYPGQTDAMGNPVPPFVEANKDKMTLRVTAWDANGNEKSQEFDLVVVGVMAADYNAGYFTDSGLLMRISDIQMLEKTYLKLSGQKENQNNGVLQAQNQSAGYQQVYVKVDDVDNVAGVEQQLKDLGYDTWSMTQIREEMQASVAQSQLILGGIAAISLLVAAINIVNTMTMAIYERTREIGVMKVMGCELVHIRAMFLVESGAIGFLGGVVGVVLSLIISFVLNHITAIMGFFGSSVDLSGLLGSLSGGWGGTGSAVSIVPAWLILLALVFATLVGLLSGIAPAGRAVKISALEAIRHE